MSVKWYVLLGVAVLGLIYAQAKATPPASTLGYEDKPTPAGLQRFILTETAYQHSLLTFDRGDGTLTIDYDDGKTQAYRSADHIPVGTLYATPAGSVPL